MAVHLSANMAWQFLPSFRTEFSIHYSRASTGVWRRHCSKKHTTFNGIYMLSNITIKLKEVKPQSPKQSYIPLVYTKNGFGNKAKLRGNNGRSTKPSHNTGIGSSAHNKRKSDPRINIPSSPRVSQASESETVSPINQYLEQDIGAFDSCAYLPSIF